MVIKTISHGIGAAACLLIFGLCLGASAAVKSVGALPLTQYVNPFGGTARGGNVFPGAVWPQGLVQFSPDTLANIPGGYKYSDTSIRGFSLTHFSGRGCTAYQDVPFMPIFGNINGSPTALPFPYASPFSHTDETARPGYYKVHLASRIGVELTSTMHTGFAKFTFPGGPSGTILVNATGSVNGNGDPTNFMITGDREVSGTVTSKVGCGKQTYTLYFIAEFDRPFAAHGIWNEATVTDAAETVSGGQSGVYVSFDTSNSSVIQLKTAISYVSLENARKNLIAESPAWSFEQVEDANDAAWNTLLNRIQISGANRDDDRTFYTALYHSFIHPNVFNDVNGQYMGFDGNVHTVAAGHTHYENISSWDFYRSLTPLQTLLQPNETSDMVQSLVDDAKQGGGGLPRWEQTSRNSNGMVGDSPAILVADAYGFGARDFDTESALKAMEAAASDPETRSDGQIVRAGLANYLSEGYIPGVQHEASSSLEYESDDFALSQFALELGDSAASQRFLKQAQNWKNQFCTARGYIVPRNKDGSWFAAYDPASSIGFTEGSGTQYTWLVPFDLGGLFANMGGVAVAADRLDKFFVKLNAGPSTTYAWMGNEPCFEVPWEYDWAGKPAGTQEVNRRIQDELFSAESNGLPGNDDGGATSSWYVWSVIGLYPEIPGVAGFAVGSPRYKQITISPEGGGSIVINADKASTASFYVQSLRVNGTIYNSPWIPYALLKKGGALVFDLGPNASNWGTGASDAPPSFDSSPNVAAPAG